MLLAACHEEPPPEKAAPPPVVHVPPVETRPFEDGYNAGYELGQRRSAHAAKIPTDAEVAQLAHEQAGTAPERTEKWQRGFVEGYLDGFRKVAQGEK
jgi:flagellar biosynthesis/type III secretory pathway protein FliH